MRVYGVGWAWAGGGKEMEGEGPGESKPLGCHFRPLNSLSDPLWSLHPSTFPRQRLLPLEALREQPSPGGLSLPRIPGAQRAFGMHYLGA